MTTLSLKDSELLRQRTYIAGRWCEADNRKSFPVTNPATGEVLAQVPDMEATETRRAIEAAIGACLEWRRRTAKERATLLPKWYDLMMANADDLALIMRAEAASRNVVAFIGG
jgi:succinate-semialdehyde dehydrogenase / glutarate-semialdehyde dehydrogenase